LHESCWDRNEPKKKSSGQEKNEKRGEKEACTTGDRENLWEKPKGGWERLGEGRD